MPETTLRAARHDRKGIEPGTKRRPPMGAQQRQEADTCAAIADSLHTLRLQPKAGVEVYFLQERNPFSSYCSFGATDQRKMIDDLWSSYVMFCEEMGLGAPQSNLLKGAIGGLILKSMINTMNKVLQPKGFELNIDMVDRKEKSYHFTIYKECSCDNDTWYAIFVKYAFRALRKHPKHFGLFVCFLASISKHFGIGNWYGEASIAEDWLLEKLDDQDGEDEDAKDDYAKTLHSYQAGEAWLAKQMLQRCALATGEEILELSDGLKWTARLRHIKEAIQIGARLMAKYNCKLWEFEYQHHSEYEEMHFSTCFGLMWEYEDHYTTEYEEYLQSLHSEGAGWVATLNYPIKADQQDITTQEFFQRVPTLEQFPRDLQTAMEHICGLLNYYLPKKKR